MTHHMMSDVCACNECTRKDEMSPCSARSPFLIMPCATTRSKSPLYLKDHALPVTKGNCDTLMSFEKEQSRIREKEMLQRQEQREKQEKKGGRGGERYGVITV